jgi:hypothetical protein
MDEERQRKAMSDAFSRMADSFLRMADAIEQAHRRLQGLLWEEYGEAGLPYGPTHEGLQRWISERSVRGAEAEGAAGGLHADGREDGFTGLPVNIDAAVADIIARRN